MKEFVFKTIQSTSRNGLLIDTNLLLLLFIGEYDPSLITKFKRTIQFDMEDLSLLKNIIQPFNRLLTTPTILAEVSNLSNQLPAHIKGDYYALFAKKLELLEEVYVPSVEIGKMTEFTKYGLTDTTILYLSRQNPLILTIDFPLANLLEKRGISVLNFNHIRGFSWFN